MRRTPISILIAGVALLLSGAMATAATPIGTRPTMTEPAAATESAAATADCAIHGRFSFGTDLALDRAGRRHIAATSGRGDLWYATDRSGSWVAKRILDAGDGMAWAWPSVATDASGRVHIAVVLQTIWDTPSSTAGIWYMTDTGRARGDFGPRRKIAGDMMTSPSLRVVDGVRYLAYSRCLCAPGDTKARLHFKTDRGGSWSKEKVAGHGLWPSLRVAADGRAMIAYKARNGLRYTTARTRFGDFLAPVRIPGSDMPGEPSLALGGAGRPHVVWTARGDSDRVRYVKRTAHGWSTVRDLGPGLKAELSLDARSRPHVVIEGLGWVKHRWLAQGTWRQHWIADISSGPADVDIRAYGNGATIAWVQYDTPRGVWVTHD